MRTALAALLILLLIAVLTGTLKFPTQDELILLLSSSVILVFAWIRSREKRAEKGENKE